MALDNRIKNRIDANIAKLKAGTRADSLSDPNMRIKKRVAEVACLMALIHGGDWRVQIDHEEGFVYVTRRLRQYGTGPSGI